MYGKQVKSIERATFVLVEDGRVAKIFSPVRPRRQAEVLAAL